MRRLLDITDYKIRSAKIYRGTLFIFGLVIFIILLAEIFINLKSTTLTVLAPLAAINFTLILFSFRFSDSQTLRSLFPISIYFLIEIHYIINPTTIHVISYWFPFVAIIALIIQGTRVFQVWVILLLITYVFNFIYLNENIGDSYSITVYKTPFLVTGITFLFGTIATSFLLYTLLGSAYSQMKTKAKELEDKKGEIEEKNQLLEKYQRELIKLTRDESLFSASQNQLFKIVCESASKTLNVNRVSIWLFENNNTSLIRNFLFELDNSSDDAIVLTKSEFPNYFNAVESKPFILASNARTHPDTCEFTNSYLTPLNIQSMLDCPIVFDRKPIGVVCCENQYTVKNWCVEDTLFTQSLADIISISYKNERITNLLSEVRQKNFQLIEKNNEIETMNGELNALNDELLTTNDSLEDTVRNRTKELETQNTQLTEYAFINSHLLRAPLARILGLSYLLTKEATSIKESQLIDALISSTNELDNIIKKISDILYDGNNLTRDDIKSIIDRNLNEN